ncbi:MAG: HEAT repeat domain-containing protein, partial [Planctomycetota bacterium]
MAPWRTWWAVNDRALLPERASEDGVTTPTPDDEVFAAGLRARREMAVREEILPALRQVLAPEAGGSDLLRRTGLLALGKVGQTEEDTALLVYWLTNPRASQQVREAAALGIGLLRRSDPLHQFDTHVLDALRARLARVSEDTRVPEDVRATCVLSIGLLGDQPFGRGIHRDGRFMTQVIWRSLKHPYARMDMPVALLTALGMQPAAGVPDGVRDALNEVALGRPALRRRWDDLERAHALTALVRLQGADALGTLRVVLKARRGMPGEVRRSALIAVGQIASALTPEDRLDLASGVRSALRRARDPLTKGLGQIAVGRLVSAHAGAGDAPASDVQYLWRHLLAEARSGSVAHRGFAVLGLGLAARPERDGTSVPPSLRAVRDEAEEILLAGLESEWGDADLRGAYAIALGIMRATSAVPELVGRVQDERTIDVLRADAAVALGQIGHAGPEVIRALHLALSERKAPRVQAGAALGLSLLRGPGADSRLLRELESARTATEVLRLTEPLGYLGDPALARPLIDYATSPANADYPRAFMLVALGNIGDPAKRPS